MNNVIFLVFIRTRLVSATKGIYEEPIKSPLLAELLSYDEEPSPIDIANQLKHMSQLYSSMEDSAKKIDGLFLSNLNSIYEKLVPYIPTDTFAAISNVLQVNTILFFYTYIFLELCIHLD